MADTENDETYFCSAQTYPQTLETPAEYCENEVDEDGDYCAEHGGYDDLDAEPDDFDDYRHGMGRYSDDYYDD